MSCPKPLVLDAMCLNHFARADRLDVLREFLVTDDTRTTYVVIGTAPRRRGEASVFALAELVGGTAVTDDRAAIRVARKYGLDVHGTVWLLSRACRDGKLTEVAAGNIVDLVRATGMRLPCTGAEFGSWARGHELL